jgi:hypothetical protein
MLSFGLLSLGLLISTGCGQTSAVEVKLDPSLAAQRNQVLLADEPADAVGILELRDAKPGDSEVVVFGRVGGVADPWTKDRASFVITDPTLAGAEAQGHTTSNGEACNCPFCVANRKPNDGIAIVELVGEDGQIMPFDARRVLGLAVDETIVVRGKARVDGLGNLVVAANGCYIRR